MNHRAIIAAIMSAIVATAGAAEQPLAPPEVRLQVAPPFRTNSVNNYGAGEDILKSPPFHLTTKAAMIQHLGVFEPTARKPKKGYQLANVSPGPTQ